jgi:hypothetical protein
MNNDTTLNPAQLKFVPKNTSTFLMKFHVSFPGHSGGSAEKRRGGDVVREIVRLTADAMRTGSELPTFRIPSQLKAEYLRLVEIDRIEYDHLGKEMFKPRKNYNWLTGLTDYGR